ncbi:MAG: BspA family leucine-rich repeat surface protein, partial [Candidatus Thermoplasmatota archaeon]|nr:BspA family leucine-rich repeat surface protein [Candidatus Thermoplasmatota archaeon]
MNKAFLLTICLLLTSFTGCIETEDNIDTTVIEETEDTTANQNNETNNTSDNTNDIVENDLVEGCTNSTAHNYNPNATDDDGTCDYGIAILYNTQLIQNSESGLLADQANLCVLAGSDATTIATDYFSENNMTFIAVISEDENQITARLIDESCHGAIGDYLAMQDMEKRELITNEGHGFQLSAILKGNGVLSKDEILGCTDSTAFNYNAEANEDDGTCEFNFKPENRDELKAAVDEWIADSYSANSTYGHISIWDTSLITDMSELFYDQWSFNYDISEWDTSSVTNMSLMFHYAEDFNQDISNWDVSSVNDMSYMFEIARSFNQDISNWNVSSVTTMKGMFAYTDFNHDISDWDVSNVVDMRSMFFSADNFNQDISDWDVSNVVDMESMFFSANSFNQNISGWDVSSVTSMKYMFSHTDDFN